MKLEAQSFPHESALHPTQGHIHGTLVILPGLESEDLASNPYLLLYELTQVSSANWIIFILTSRVERNMI